jgi:hypothetical protein
MLIPYLNCGLDSRGRKVHTHLKLNTNFHPPAP